MIRLASCILTAALAAACANDTPPTGDAPFQIEDSAGVRIVTHHETSSTEPAFRLSTKPRYRHGANPGDYAFQGIGVGRLFPDGSAVVSDEWASELVVIARDGAAYEVLATEGEGPGEVSYISAMFVLGRDSILAADPLLGRVTIFAGGSVARTADLRRFIGVGVVGIGPSGELLLATTTRRSEADWVSGHMARFDMETGAIDTVAAYDFRPPIPSGLDWNPLEAVGQVTAAAGQFVHTRSDRPEVTWRQPDGTTTQIVRWRAEPTLLTEESLGPIEAVHRMEIRMHDPELSDARLTEVTRQNMAAYHASIGRPLPLFASPFADAAGRVWLPSYRAGGELKSVPPYIVITPDGEWLGTVGAPPRFRILDVAGGLVLGVELDELDVESVVVYELVDS